MRSEPWKNGSIKRWIGPVADVDWRDEPERPTAAGQHATPAGRVVPGR